MSHDCVVAVYDSASQATAAVKSLEQAHYPHDQISLVTRRGPNGGAPVEAESVQLGDRAENQAAKGAGLGGVIGALLAVPIVVATGGAGAILLAGPVAMGLTGGVVGGLIGAMKGWGIHEDRLREYEALVREGAALVIASGDPEQLARADKLLQETDVREVTLHAKDSGDEVDP